MSSFVFVGIDVSQARLDIAVRPGTSFSITHGESAIAALVQQLCALSPTLIVLEATGGMEIPLTSALATAGLPVVVINPRQVRDFAKASGHLAKTDALDAQVLAQFAEVMRPQPRPLPDAETRALAARLTRRRQLVEMLTAEKNRLLSAAAVGIQENMKGVRKALIHVGLTDIGAGHAKHFLHGISVVCEDS